MLAIPNEGKVDEANYFFQLIKMQMNDPTVIFNVIKLNGSPTASVMNINQLSQKLSMTMRRRMRGEG